MASKLKFGLIGLGNAGNQILTKLLESPNATLMAAAEPQADNRETFTRETGLPAVSSIDELLKLDIDAVWVATPNEMHAPHVIAAAQSGRHVICEKPMALTVEDCDRMIAAAEANGVKLMLGHSKLIEPPIVKMREIIDSGALGSVIQVSLMNYNDWLQRPRFSNELDTSQGGGICYRQAPHQVDIVRYLVGRPVRTVRSLAGRADPNFATEGHYSTFLEFDGSVAATLTYNAYGYFHVAELTWDIGEGGNRVVPLAERMPKARLTGPVTAGTKYSAAKERHGGQKVAPPFYGLTVVSCERGVLRQSPKGVFVYDESGVHEIEVPLSYSIERDLGELVSSIEHKRPPFPDGHWGRATTQVCLAMLESSRLHAEIELSGR